MTTTPYGNIKKCYARNKPDKHYTLYKKDGTTTGAIEERQARWAEWIQTCFQTPPGQEIPKPLYIPEETWGQLGHSPPEQLEMLTPSPLLQIRKQSPLQQLFLQYPHVETWIARPYDRQEIQRTILHMKTTKLQEPTAYPGNIRNT